MVETFLHMLENATKARIDDPNFGNSVLVQRLIPRARGGRTVLARLDLAAVAGRCRNFPTARMHLFVTSKSLAQL